MPFLTAFYHNRHASALQALVANSSARVFVAYGDQDQFTGVSKFDVWSQQLQDKGLQTVTVQKVGGADHFWHGSPMKELKQGLDAWLESLGDSSRRNA
jgi:alpha/beta superfamily hydrolase